MVQHSCLYYTTDEDYINLVIPFFAQGLRGNNFCLWIIPPRWDIQTALRVLRARIPEADKYLCKSQFEIVCCNAWYGESSAFDPERMLDRWRLKERDVVDRGFAGLWASGDASWIQVQDWDKLQAYEERIQEVIRSTKITALCTYPSESFDMNRIFLLSFSHATTMESNNGRLHIIRQV